MAMDSGAEGVTGADESVTFGTQKGAIPGAGRLVITGTGIQNTNNRDNLANLLCHI